VYPNKNRNPCNIGRTFCGPGLITFAVVPLLYPKVIGIKNYKCIYCT